MARRAIILVMDSFGLGATPDAPRFGDDGADTLGHIAEARYAAGKPLALPNLTRLGLGLASNLVHGQVPPGLAAETVTGAYGVAREVSRGKDTPSGHWEIAGCPVPFDWGYFPETVPCFPESLVARFIAETGIPGILGNCHASGTEIIERLGEDHIQTGKPICYTSADSVFQIAAHETHFGLERLYAICAVAKRLTEPLQIARVIARPFIGERRGQFQRTSHRRDLTTPPPEETLLDRVAARGNRVHGIGKIADIFAGRGVSATLKGENNMGLFDRTLEAVAKARDGDVVFANFVDFDTLYGHRRNVDGYAAALEEFDRRLPELEARLEPGDLVLLTADHGCDPTFKGTDHTREHVPVIFFGPGVKPHSIGVRASFADMGQTLAAHLGLTALKHGVACPL
ncbi:MAG TPA: phosphopentomutase [Dongiaceae bacterium]|jgi:phosphopentomutase|nr:phosphopentomutase [Dongiaceae bacterium]